MTKCTINTERVKSFMSIWVTYWHCTY